MAVPNEVPVRRTGQQAPMLPGMPAEEIGERAPIRVHLALDAERPWGLSAHLLASSVDPVWPAAPEEIANDEPVIARLGTPDAPGIPLELLRSSGARLIVIVPDSSDEALVSAAAAGAWAAVPESEAHVILADVVREVSEGRSPLLQAAASRTDAASAILAMLREAWSRQPDANPPSPLNQREAHMLRMVSEGVTNREIARRLSLSEQTVKNYLSMVFEKTGTRSRAQAATKALEYGWLRED